MPIKAFTSNAKIKASNVRLRPRTNVLVKSASDHDDD